jgi:hypothetical protein
MDVAEIASLPAEFVRQLARFERVSPFTSSMGTAAALGIALAISRVISPKARVQQAESTGREAILDGGLA